MTQAYGTSNATTTTYAYDNSGRKTSETDALTHTPRRTAIHKTEHGSSPTRIPAPGLEKAVTDRILSLLNAPSELLTVLRSNLPVEENAPPNGFYTAVVERAGKMVQSWKLRLTPDRHQFLKAVIDRIVVRAEHIEIRLRLAAILHET